MTKNNGTLDDYSCSQQGLLLPLINEFTWPLEVRAFLYLLGMLYCFLGVAILADIFMGAIEKITSSTRKVRMNGPICLSDNKHLLVRHNCRHRLPPKKSDSFIRDVSSSFSDARFKSDLFN